MRHEKQRKLEAKLSAFLDGVVYPVRFRGWQWSRITDSARQRTHGDVEFRRGSDRRYVDEKAYSSLWSGCLLELIQDVPSRDMGWYYTLTHCTHLVCGYFDGWDKAVPQIVYKIDLPRLRSIYCELCKTTREVRHDMSSQNYGITVFGKVPWRYLKDACEVIWSAEATKPEEIAAGGWARASARKAVVA